MKFLTLCYVSLMLLGVSSADGVKWEKDWDTALKSAQSSKKMIMIDFYTDWCGWCKKLDADVFQNVEFEKVSKDFLAVKLNAEKEGETLAKKFEVDGFPTIVFVDSKGDLVGKIVGYLPLPDFTHQTKLIQNSFNTFSKSLDTVKTKPNDADALSNVALGYALRGKVKESEEFLTRAEKANATGESIAWAYNTLGDVYYDKDEMDKAVEMFKKADKTAKEPFTKSYAKISLAVSYYYMDKVEECKKVCKELIEMKGANPEHVKVAKEILEEIG